MLWSSFRPESIISQCSLTCSGGTVTRTPSPSVESTTSAQRSVLTSLPPRHRTHAPPSRPGSTSAGAGLAPRRTRSRAGRLGVAPCGGGPPAQGPRPADATHGGAAVGADARPPRRAGRRRRRSAAFAAARLARLESIEATGVLDIDVSWVNGNYQRILFHSVRTASAHRVREMAAPRRHLALVCFLHQAWRDTLDQAVEGKSTAMTSAVVTASMLVSARIQTRRHRVDPAARCESCSTCALCTGTSCTPEPASRPPRRPACILYDRLLIDHAQRAWV